MTHLNALLKNVAALHGVHVPTAHHRSVLYADSRLSYWDGNIRNAHPCVSTHTVGHTNLRVKILMIGLRPCMLWSMRHTQHLVAET